MELEDPPRLGVEPRCNVSVEQRESCFGCALLSHSISRWMFWILGVVFSLMGKNPYRLAFWCSGCFFFLFVCVWLFYFLFVWGFFVQDRSSLWYVNICKEYFSEKLNIGEAWTPCIFFYFILIFTLQLGIAESLKASGDKCFVGNKMPLCTELGCHENWG